MAAEKIIFLDQHRAPVAQPGRARLLRLDVMAPDNSGKYHANIIDWHIDPAMDAPANLEHYAQALEEIAERFRSAARRDAS